MKFDFSICVKKEKAIILKSKQEKRPIFYQLIKGYLEQVTQSYRVFKFCKVLSFTPRMNDRVIKNKPSEGTLQQHHFAKKTEKSLQNSTNTFFLLSLAILSKFLPTSTLTGFLSQSSGISSLIKCGFSFPSRYDCVNVMMFSAVISVKSGLNFVISSSRLIKRSAGRSSFFKPKNSIIRALSSMSVLM